MKDADFTKSDYNYLRELKSKCTKNLNEKFPKNSRTDKMALPISPRPAKAQGFILYMQCTFTFLVDVKKDEYCFYYLSEMTWEKQVLNIF